ncbi:MAG TPA: Abi-alpha family protein [Thermoleophilaceae bacterium]|jgi:hypothetical protein
MSTNGEFTRYSAPAYTDAEPEPVRDPGLTEILPGLARIGAVAYWRGTKWGVETSVRVGVRVVRFAASGQAPADLLAESGRDLRVWLRRFIDVVDESAAAAAGGASTDGHAAAGHASANGSANGHVPLRERGAELLRRSADVRYDDECHPAYERILEEMAPDEARILRFMCADGPQASVDVRTGGPIGMLSSQLVAPGLTMIAANAGCRRPERVHQYLNNLHRLGLIWFSRETLEDQAAYQVLEAQPEVGEAMKRAGRGRTVRRSIHLTPFGEDFCKAALPLDTAEIDALPRPADGEPVDAELA